MFQDIIFQLHMALI